MMPTKASALTLSYYSRQRDVMTKDKVLMKMIGNWQRAGLVRVQPVTKDYCTVELTDAGRVAAA